MNSEIGWVFIYIFGFGISDFIVRKYIKKDIFYVIYYLLFVNGYDWILFIKK